MQLTFPRIFHSNADNAGGLSTFRLNLLRLYLLLLCLAFGKTAWTSILAHQGPWDPLQGVAYSFWAALSIVAAFGLRNPIKMVALPLLQLVYKTIWLALVVYPQWSKGVALDALDPETFRLAKLFIVVIVFDLIVIPWPYLIRSHFLQSE